MKSEMRSRNAAIWILAALLVAALIAGAILYRDHLATKEALQVSEKKLRQMNEERIPSQKAMIADLRQRLQTIQSQLSDLEKDRAATLARLEQLQAKYDAELPQVAELETAKEKISGLNRMLHARDQTITQLEERLTILESDAEKEKGVLHGLRQELSSKNARVASLERERKGNQSLIAFLEEETIKDRKEIQGLQDQLSELRGDKEIAASEIGRMKTTYDKLIADLHTQLKNREVDIKTYREKISVTFVDRILFDSGKADISPEGRRVLKKVGETLKEVQGRQIRIIGHTDDVPIMEAFRHKFPTNWELSTARAAAVARYFQKDIGLDPRHLEAVGRSFYDPIAGNETARGRAQNRRVNIIIGPEM